MMETVSGDSRKVRRVNRELILDVLRKDGEASLADLAGATSLSPATCSNIVAGLLADGSAVELDQRESRGGRPARRFRYNPEHVLAAAVMVRVDDGEERLAAAVADAAGRVLAEAGETHRNLGVEHLDALLARLVHEWPALRAVAISVPGVVGGGRIRSCDVPGLAGQELERRVKAVHGLEATIENDMNFAAMGYWRSLAGRAASGLAYFVFPRDACAGAGLVVNGTLVRGMSNFAGEISFLPFGEDRASRAKRPGDKRRQARYIATIVSAVAAVINPDVAVLSGDSVAADMLADIRRFCLESLPPEHAPELVVQPDYAGDCRAGMLAAALERLGCGYRLVKTERI